MASKFVIYRSRNEHNLELNETNAINGMLYSHQAVFKGRGGFDYMASCITFTSKSRVPAGRKYQVRFSVYRALKLYPSEAQTTDVYIAINIAEDIITS